MGLLSAGMPFEDFTQVMQVAFDEGGASGLIAGRSVWRESLALSGPDRTTFQTIAGPAGDLAVGRRRPGAALDQFGTA